MTHSEHFEPYFVVQPNTIILNRIVSILRGNGNSPPLAARSPSYLARQLYDIQQYTRNGPGTQLMRPVVQNLTQDDILAITAYLASPQP